MSRSSENSQNCEKKSQNFEIYKSRDYLFFIHVGNKLPYKKWMMYNAVYFEIQPDS